MINVTKSYVPNKANYMKYVEQIFDSGWLTNNGALTRMLKLRLDEYLDVNNTVLVSNGTLALQAAYKLLGLHGEVITTPFSFVATTSSLVWEGLTPVFVDIDEESFCIDPKKIENKITDKTTAIVATHVFGNVCDIESIEAIAKRHNLKVIYDAAHSFGSLYKGKSVYSYGDISTASFHSTKIFHTVEGGAIFANSKELEHKARNVINFGILGPEEIEEVGINAKMNEFEAAMGLCLLDELPVYWDKRKAVYKVYEEAFKLHKKVRLQKRNEHSTPNYSYFPIVLEDERSVLEVMEKLSQEDIHPRRYFYPSLDTLPYVISEPMEKSRILAGRILCLPMYDSLPNQIQSDIIRLIKEVLQ